MQVPGITVVGHLVSEVRCSVDRDGESRSWFRITSSSHRPDPMTGGLVLGQAIHVEVRAKGALADNCATSLVMGDPVVVSGEFRLRSWESGRAGDGMRHRGIAIVIDARAVGHDLAVGTSAFTRPRRGPTFASLLEAQSPQGPVVDSGRAP